MANTTVRGALAIHGQNPQHLVETVIRNRIYESSYWKEHCFALTAESLIDKAIELHNIGGVYGNQRPTEFLCLILKLLQIQPQKEILLEYLQADEFKYLRALSAMYIRMTFNAIDVYSILEPLLKDYRRLRYRDMAGYSLIHMDEFVYSLLTEERVCDIILPRLIKRDVLEENGDIGPRRSLLLEAMEGKEVSDDRSDSHSRTGSDRSGSAGGRTRGRTSRSPSSSRTVSETGSRYVSRSPSRSRSRSRSGSNSPYRSRSQSISQKNMEVNGD